MAGRLIHHGIRSLAAIALVLAVLILPICPSRTLLAPSTPNNVSRHAARIGHRGPSVQSNQAAMKQAHILEPETKDELEAEIEDDLIVISPPAPAFFQVLPSPCPEFCSDLASLAVALVSRPLRC